MRVLFIGDVFADIGRRVLAERLESLLCERHIDVCVANGENVAGGRGITHPLYSKLRSYGIQVVTGGNHSFANKDVRDAFLCEPYLLRPANFPKGNAGRGSALYHLSDGRTLGIINVQGRIFFNEHLECPLRTAEAAVAELAAETKMIFVDIHAEASSEKLALAHYLDGRVSAVVGTHTHVQTADERILPGGTAFLTDVGMTGPEYSVIGMKKDTIIKKFLLQTHQRFEPATMGPMLNAVVIEIDDSSGKAVGIERVFERLEFK